MLAADFGDGHGVLGNVGSGGRSRAVEFRDDQANELQIDSSGSPSRDSLDMTFADASIVRATPISRMEILRTLPGGEYTRVTFGTARFRWAEREGQGIYEYAALV
jgi:hypothetical protein